MTFRPSIRSIQIAVVTMLAMVVMPLAAFAERPPSGRFNEAELRRMIGQMILVGFVGDNIDSQGFQIVHRQALEGEITGVIYLRRNISRQADVLRMNASLQAAARGRMLISIDQEGGRIERLTDSVGFGKRPSAAKVAKMMSPAEALRLYEDLANDLAKLGFNVNFGPVVDVNINPRNPIIGRLGRSFSSNPDEVIAYAQAFIDAHAKFGVLTSLKHFPGHGSSIGDSHKGPVDITDTWQEEAELRPYRALLGDLNVSMVMSAHVINRRLSGRAVPASLSSEVLQDLLRKEIRYSGVIISDDMQMDAIATTRSFQQGVREAVMAGNDILIFANDKNPDPDIPRKVIDFLVKEALTDKKLRDRIGESALRIKRMKDAALRSASPVQLPTNSLNDATDLVENDGKR